jgi:hypothetical protein
MLTYFDLHLFTYYIPFDEQNVTLKLFGAEFLCPEEFK